MQPPDGSLPRYEPERVRPPFWTSETLFLSLFFGFLAIVAIAATGHWLPLVAMAIPWFLQNERARSDEAVWAQRNRAIDAANAVPQSEVERAAMREMASRDRTINDALASTAGRTRSHKQAGRLYEAQLAARINGWLYKVGSRR